MRPLFLVGFMATGKTTVGRMVAHATGRRFVDLDERVEAREGAPAGELVARDERAFRAAEAAALAEVLAEAATDPAVVVATGGGAAAHGDNLARMRAAGLVVALTADLEVVRARAVRGPRRPLLEGDPGAAAALLRARTVAYRRAHAAVAADDADAPAVASRVAAVLAASQRLPPGEAQDDSWLALGDRTYPVVVREEGLDGELVRLHLPDATTRVAVIADAHVAAAWGGNVVAALRGAGLDAALHAFPPGEASKTLATHGSLCERLVADGLDRRSAIVALGGGVTGDLAGFVAATLFRGLPVIQLPTSLVAMVDSAIGGKTGVDLDAGKNLVGAFWQPRAVIACLPWLDTLPLRERRAAFGELWKYALLDPGDTWEQVAALASWARGEAELAPAVLAAVVRRAAALKAWVVGRDEREVRGERALLNLGHTVGHAIESAAGWRLLHGECVALGLLAAARVSRELVGAPAGLEDDLRAALAACGLDTALEPWLTEPVLARLGADKKRAGGRLGFVTVRARGECEVVDVELRRLASFLLRRGALC